MESSRRHFIKTSSILAAASALPARWARAGDLSGGRKLKLRFAIASDLHYGQENTPYAQMADDLVDWINQEQQGWPRHGVYAKEEVEKAEAVMDLLESTANLRGVFHGHNHLETGMWVSGEQRYFFDSHVGGSWGAAKGYRIGDNRSF